MAHGNCAGEAVIDITKFDGHTAGPWWFDNPGRYKVASIAALCIYADARPSDCPTPDANLIAAAPDLLAEVIRLRAMLQKARDGLSCGLWDYGPGQSEHDQCDELLAEIDEALKGGAA